MAEHREFPRLLIEYPDRLARFGYDYLERYLNSHGVTIESPQVHEPKTSSEELVWALVSPYADRIRNKIRVYAHYTAHAWQLPDSRSCRTIEI